MKKCVVVYNPQSGKKRDINKKFKGFEQIFDKYEYEVEFIPTKCKGDAADIVEKLEYVDLVLVAGGDGTLNEAIIGNLRRKNKLVLAQLPFGTQNDVARMYGLTNNTNRNLELILNGSVKNVDICLINDRPFTYVACMGSYVDIAYATPRKLKEKYGRLAYVIYGIKQLKETFHYFNLEYSTNDKSNKNKYSFIFITNTVRIGGFNIKGIYPDVKLNDNKFEIFMCKINNKFDIFRAIHYLKHKDMKEIPGFKYIKTNDINIKFDETPSISWCVDGEEYRCDTNEFNIKITKEISMLLPDKNIDSLFEKEN